MYDMNENKIEYIYEEWVGSLWMYVWREIYTWEEIATVEKNIDIVHSFRLYQNYPNPANPVSIIKFSLQKSTPVTLKIYDILGREVALLVNERKLAGEHTVSWDAVSVPSGVYFYRMVAGYFIETKKMVVMK
jgi:flagellar hook assembly protein FlgD